MSHAELSLLKQIEKTIEDICYTGLTAISDSTFQRLSAVINECSSQQLSRLASALRIATGELKKTVNGSKDIDHSKYSFFLNQSWLLTKGLMKAREEGNKILFEKYSGAKKEKEVIPSVEVIPIGLEKGLIDSQWLMFKVHFRVIKCPGKRELEKQIITLTQMFDVKGTTKAIIHSEKELTKAIKGLNESIGELITPIQKLKLIKWDYNSTYSSFSVGKDSDVKMLENSKVTDYLPLFRPKEFLQYLNGLQITPLDFTYTFTYYTGFPDIRVQNCKKSLEGLQFHFEYESLKINVNLPTNNTNKTLITQLEGKIASNKKISYLYGVLVISSTELIFTPLSIIEKGKSGSNDQFVFLTVDEEKLKEHAAETKKESNKKGVKHTKEKDKHLALLGGFNAKKKK